MVRNGVISGWRAVHFRNALRQCRMVSVAILALAAHGLSQTVSLSTTHISFAKQAIATTSNASHVTLTNTGTSALAISSISASPPFAQTSTCGATLKAGSKCTISVTFTPTVTGTITGTLTISDNASGSPHTVGLTGTAVLPVTLAPAKASFPSTTVGTTSAPVNFTLTNNLSTALAISSISASGDYLQSNTCSSSVAAKGTCTISVAFAPTAVGARPGTLTVSDSASNSPQTAPLSGSGSLNGLTSILITPANPSLAVGATQQLQGIGTFNDGRTYDVTESLTWTSSKSKVATVSNTAGTKGLTSALASGTPTIKASALTIAAMTTVTVLPSLVSISLTPLNPTIVLGQIRQFSATGHYSDHSTQNITNSVSWTSSAPNVATISNTGLASSVGTQSTTITASLGGVSASTVLTVNPAALVSLAVTPSTASIALGTTQQFKAIATYTDGSTLDVTNSVVWSSSASGVAVVSNAAGSQGLATSKGLGTAAIKAASGAVSGSANLTVTQARLTQIVITPALPTIAVGLTQQFAATGMFTDGSTQDLTATAQWSSSDITLATVSNAAGSQGLATGAGVGTATISAAVGTVSGGVPLTITPAALVSIAVTPGNAQIVSGTTQQYTATGTFSNNSTQDLTGSVTWTSSSTDVAAINNAGLATGVAAGNTMIAASLGGVAGSTALMVTPSLLVSIAVSPTDASIPLGTTQVFTALGTFNDGSAQDVTAGVHWSSSDGTVATVSNSTGSQGLATATGLGTVSITATSGTVSGSANLSISAAVLVSITIDPQNPSIPLGTTQLFTATGNYSDGTTQDLTALATWTSSAPPVAVVGSSGAATTAGTGVTTITATFGSQSAATSLTVTAAALLSIAVAPQNPSLVVGATLQFTATGSYSDGTSQDLTAAANWSSSNPVVAAVSNSSDSAGLVSALAAGSSQITATSGAVAGSSTLSVNPDPISVTVAPSSFTMGIGSNLQFTAAVTGAPISAVTWQVNGITGGNASVGTINVVGFFIAPIALPASPTVVVTAVAQADSFTSGSASVNLTLTEPLGSASGISIACPNSTISGSCYAVDLNCPGVPDFTAYLKVTPPSGPAIGTVMFTGGGSGTGLYESYVSAPLAITTVVQAGYTVVQTSFGGPFVSNPNGWFAGGGAGVRRLACRYATLAQWVYDNIHQADTSRPLCATGNSAGGQMIGESLAHYGMGSIFAMVEPTSGPPYARTDWACECNQVATPSYCSGSSNGQCVGLSNAQQYVDPAYPTPKCSAAVTTGSTADAAQFLSDSLLSPDATLAYPKTYVHFLFGGQDTSSAINQGMNWHSLITTSSDIACVADGPHTIADVMDGAQQIAADIINYCHLQ